MKKIRNISLLVILTPSGDEVNPFSVLVVQPSSGRGKLALPFIEYNGDDTDMRNCISNYVNDIIAFGSGDTVSPENLSIVQSYCIALVLRQM